MVVGDDEVEVQGSGQAGFGSGGDTAIDGEDNPGSGRRSLLQGSGGKAVAVA